MKTLKVKFYRLDIFNNCIKNEDFINENLEIIVAIENECVILKDVVIDNTEQLARLNILTFLKKEIDGIDLIENQEAKITHINDVIPNELITHVLNEEQRLICEIIEVKNISA